jgi:serine-type D-Ala-D-Ala carboxypeptidase/endopeptidase
MSNGPTVGDIVGHVLDPSFPISACPASVPAAKTQPASYAGIYCNPSSGLEFIVDAARKPDKLSIALVPQRAAEVTRTAPDTYAFAMTGATFKFVRQDDKVVGLWLLQNGQEIAAVRLDARGKPFVAQLQSPFPAGLTLDPTVLQQYVGSYIATGVGTFTVTLRGTKLYVQLTGQPALPVFASAKDEFFYKVVDAEITFHRNATGAITSLTLHQNGLTIQANR